MPEVQVYHLPPTRLIPNSQYPLLYYPGVLATGQTKPLGNENDGNTAIEATPRDVNDLFRRNGWTTQWIARYADTQPSHYHSRTHECMVVMSGTACIRFGVADTTEDLYENTYGSGYESGGVTLDVKAGDAFLIPAGVAHKTHRCRPETALALLTPGDGHGVQPPPGMSVDEALEHVELSGFTMCGVYPMGGQWDFAVGGEDGGAYHRVYAVGKPQHDPFLGDSPDGLVGRWQDGEGTQRDYVDLTPVAERLYNERESKL